MTKEMHILCGVLRHFWEINHDTESGFVFEMYHMVVSFLECCLHSILLACSDVQSCTGTKSNDSPIHLGESLLGRSDWRIKDGEYIFPRILVGKERDIGQVGVWILSKPPGAITLTLGLSGQAVSMQYSSAMKGFMVKFNCLSFENHWKYLPPT